jgi:hypothetical protein
MQRDEANGAMVPKQRQRDRIRTIVPKSFDDADRAANQMFEQDHRPRRKGAERG